MKNAILFEVIAMKGLLYSKQSSKELQPKLSKKFSFPNILAFLSSEKILGDSVENVEDELCYF